MYSNYIKPFGSNTNTGFGFAPNVSTSFGQPASNTGLFSPMSTTSIFQTPSTSSFQQGPTQTGFGSNLFGQQQQQPQSTGLFGSSSTFGQQNKPTFGFGAAPTQPGIFGQQPQTQTTGSLFQSNTPNLFGSTNAFGAQQPAGTVVKFSPVTGSDTMQKNGVAQTISTKHHCITCMKEYENKSLEELRFEDYSCNRKGPQQQSGFSAPTFGVGQPSTGSSLFATPNETNFAAATPGFGQSTAFGQPSTGFGLSNTGVGSSSVFGKPTGFGTPSSTTSTFGFNPTPAVSNPFNASQQNKPFSSQPLFGTATTQNQPTGFGTSVFGQNTQQQNQSTSLFQKPAQPTNAFNTGQSGYIFSQSSASQPSLFQTSKPNTGFSLFGQTNTTTFGTQTTLFGSKPTTSTFGQQAQQPTGFGTNIGGLQQPTLFGTNTANKPPTLFGGGNNTSLFSNNVFQQPTATFPLQMVPPQPQQPQMPDTSEDLKNLSALATDSYPDGPQSFDLEPCLLPKVHETATNPLELRKLLEFTKKQEESVHPKAKIPVLAPKPKNKEQMTNEFFGDTTTPLLLNRRCLVIKKKNDDNAPTSSFYRKHKPDIIEEIEKDLNEDVERVKSSTSKGEEDSVVDSTIQTEKIENDKNKRSLPGSPSSSSLTFTKTLPSSTFAVNTNKLSFKYIDNFDDNNSSTLDLPASTESSPNPAGVTLKRSEYYMYPAIQDLHQYMDENGRCVVPGLTIGRKGYGNVYYPDPIDITNMNFDELVHFRHRELIIYPDDCQKPPLGEGLNRRAQVTLDKIYPKEKGSNEYVTDVDKILESNFVNNLMMVTQKHNCKFVDYRPNTGSWVFKVKHFSIYSFTDSDEEECAIVSNAGKVLTKSKEVVPVQKGAIDSKDSGTQNELMDMMTITPNHGLGGGYNKQYTKSSLELPASIEEASTEFWRTLDVGGLTEKELEKRALVQNLKASLFNDDDDNKKVSKSCTAIEVEPVDMIKPYEPESDVPLFPRLDTITIKPTNIPEVATRYYSDLGLFKTKGYKVGWIPGRKFFHSHETILDIKVVKSLTKFGIKNWAPEFDIMMPDISECLKICLEESDIIYKENILPQLIIKDNLSFLRRLQSLFMNHVKSNRILGTGEYLSSVLCLINALWGDKADNYYERRNYFSNWLKKFTFNLSEKSLNFYKTPKTTEEALQMIFELMTYFQIDEAAHMAIKFNMPRLALLISQISLNDRCSDSLKTLTELYQWESGVVPNLYKKIYLLLSGIAMKEEHHICENLDWMRSLAVHLWYLNRSNVPIEVAVETYTETFQTNENVNSPKPPYNAEAETDKYDILYHILMMYKQKYYKLLDIIDPLTHTSNCMDYRFSWILMQLFSSLSLGNITEQEKNLIHTTFANQLEDIGYWQWAVFVLLYLENDLLKEYLIKRILERNIASINSSPETEEFVVKVLGIPSKWIHEIKAVQALIINHDHFEAYQHYIYTSVPQDENRLLIKKVLPDLFVHDHYESMEIAIKDDDSNSRRKFGWDTETNLIRDFFSLLGLSAINNSFVYKQLLIAVCDRIYNHSKENDQQRLPLAELSKKCALLFRDSHFDLQPETYKSIMKDFTKFLMPSDLF